MNDNKIKKKEETIEDEFYPLQHQWFDNKEEIIEPEFYPIQQYHQFDMYFLIEPKLFILRHRVKVAKSKYGYYVSNFDYEDKILLEYALKQVNGKLKIEDKGVFMNGRDSKFRHQNGSVIIPSFKEEWYITLLIQGYKTNSSGKNSPIWRLETAYLNYC